MNSYSFVQKPWKERISSFCLFWVIIRAPYYLITTPTFVLRSMDCTGMSMRHPRELFSPSLSPPRLLAARSHVTVRTRAAKESDWAERPPCTQSHSRSEIIETFVLKGCKNRNSFKRIICFYLIKDSIFLWEHNYCISVHSVCHWKSFHVPRLVRVP